MKTRCDTPVKIQADGDAYGQLPETINPQQREQILLTRLQHAHGERAAAQQAMQLSEMRYRRLFETSKDSIIIIGGADQTVIDINHAAERLLSLKKEAVRGCVLSTLYPFSIIPDMRRHLYDLAMEHADHREITFPTTGNSGLSHLDIVASVYREQDRLIVQLSMRDIADRKKSIRLEAETADLIAERQELINLNAAKDEFISVASHQLRTPATAVKQYIGLLLQGFTGRLTREQRRTLERASASNDRQLKIINDLLLVARVDAGKIQLIKEPADLSGMVRDIAAEQQPALDRRRQPLHLALPRSLKATVDARFIRMVVENLLNNASKYSPDGKPITISVRRTRSRAYIAVSDQGFGIRQADQPKLYRKFSRIYNEHATSIEGTGLGLYWSKKIVELHDGQLLLDSELHRGSTFTISLPVK